MGMDVYSRENEWGEPYFRASIWVWPAINELMRRAGVIDAELHKKMTTNDGHGPDGEQCKKIAAALHSFLDSVPKDINIFEGSPEHPPANTIVLEQLAKISGFEVKQQLGSAATDPGTNPYAVHRDHLTEFVYFVEQCIDKGGFIVR